MTRSGWKQQRSEAREGPLGAPGAAGRSSTASQGSSDSSLIKGDVVAEIRKLRQQPGRTVHTWGSTELLQTLLKNDLIDEYRLFIFPVVLGSGKRLFASGTVPLALKQVESVTSGKGGTYHRLERGGKPEYGQMGA